MKAKFRLYTYDLWSDCEGGKTVNDVYPGPEIEIEINLAKGYPTNYQLNRAVGGRGLTWEGELEYTLYATDKRGDPACELRRLLDEPPKEVRV